MSKRVDKADRLRIEIAPDGYVLVEAQVYDEDECRWLTVEQDGEDMGPRALLLVAQWAQRYGNVEVYRAVEGSP